MATNSFRYSAQAAGICHVRATVTLATTAPGALELVLIRNANEVLHTRTGVSGIDSAATGSAILRLAAGDAVQVWAFQTNSSATAMPLFNDGRPWNTFSIARVGD